MWRAGFSVFRGRLYVLYWMDPTWRIAGLPRAIWYSTWIKTLYNEDQRWSHCDDWWYAHRELRNRVPAHWWRRDSFCTIGTRTRHACLWSLHWQKWPTGLLEKDLCVDYEYFVSVFHLICISDQLNFHFHFLDIMILDAYLEEQSLQMTRFCLSLEVETQTTSTLKADNSHSQVLRYIFETRCWPYN